MEPRPDAKGPMSLPRARDAKSPLQPSPRSLFQLSPHYAQTATLQRHVRGRGGGPPGMLRHHALALLP